MKNAFYKIFFITVLSCNTSTEKKPISETKPIKTYEAPTLNLAQANRLAQLPLNCINIEYPNKLNQTIGSANDLKEPSELHPAFYGCFDWHSAVHGHWSLVSLLKQFPNLENKAQIEQRLLRNISEAHIEQEIQYFKGEYNGSFERTYGWAWLLKLAEELHTWDSDLARELEHNLKPLTELIVNKYLEFLPKLNYPIRVGEHPNTAFGLSFAHDYAIAIDDSELRAIIEKRATDFYETDKDCPIEWEPGGFDFLSPCLEEAALMKRVLSNDEFKTWITDFMPQLNNINFEMAVGEVSDRTDGKLVHLDGVNFSRAWSLNQIAEGLSEYSHLKNIANKHINYSLPGIVGDSYEGGHWLGSFAIYALNSVKK
ncbi:MAG: DUF2891 domain-containing protein [Winogradskyella sp.]|uniref:DUF2891 domain-containing protein n=1 Tax=Winogradskyella sp. TaxID=1883156 RepID=UPI001820A0BA|nr:DUF2891 domain-containing protein [Winogradskyella sp.]